MNSPNRPALLADAHARHPTGFPLPYYLRLRLWLATDHLGIAPPAWLSEAADRQVLGASKAVTVSVEQAAEYSDFLHVLWDACVLKFGRGLTETLLEHESQALPEHLYGPDPLTVEIREFERDMMELAASARNSKESACTA